MSKFFSLPTFVFDYMEFEGGGTNLHLSFAKAYLDWQKLRKENKWLNKKLKK